MTAILTDAEVSALCHPLRQYAAQIRHLERMGLRPLRRPDGAPIVLRSAYEAWKNPQPAPVALPEVKLKPARQYEGSALERYHDEQRADWATRPVYKPTAADLKAQEERKTERRAALVRHHAGKRRATKMQRTPAWADMDKIRAIYAEARRLTVATGIPHHVDHELPLQGRKVSGLHVHNNLQILTGSENSRKSNRYEP